MNFYIGNSIDEIKEQDYNVEFSDELIDFVYKQVIVKCFSPLLWITFYYIRREKRSLFRIVSELT